MKVSQISSYSPSFGIKIPKELNNDILLVTRQLYNNRTAKKLLKQIESMGSKLVVLNDFSLGFSRYSKGNVFFSFILSDNDKRSTLLRACLGEYSKKNFPLSKIKMFLNEALELFN